jgi:hypothetical protein
MLVILKQPQHNGPDNSSKPFIKKLYFIAFFVSLINSNVNCSYHGKTERLVCGTIPFS